MNQISKNQGLRDIADELLANRKKRQEILQLIAEQIARLNRSNISTTDIKSIARTLLKAADALEVLDLDTDG